MDGARATSYTAQGDAAQAAEARQALSFIEDHLFERLSVRRIACACAASPFHFSRRFSARHGESVMAYVRGRRLDAAAVRLARDPQTDLADLALSCGFGGQAAFTRAFTRAFGEPPGRYRGAPRPRPRSFRMAAKPVLHVSLERLDAMRLAGITGRFDPSTYLEVSKMWGRMTPLLPLAGQVGPETYGVFADRDRVAQSFHHLAGVQVSPDAVLQEGVEAWTLPARTYLVVKQELTEEPLYIQTVAAQATIWDDLLPNSGRSQAVAPDFQVYPTPFKLGDGGWMGHYVPLED